MRHSGIEIVHWNPRRPVFRGRIRIGRRVSNFGDLIGPRLVERLATDRRLTKPAPGRSRLLAVGSIIHFARSGDTVWGSGVNGVIGEDEYRFDDLDVRSVRGPLTRQFLLDRGIDAPEIYGDPALLLPELYPELVAIAADKRRDYVVVPNLNDYRRHSAEDPSNVLDPCSGLDHCLATIASSKYVVGSSLHAIIIAEALGIPARLVGSAIESPFKYEDYYRGTGREPIPAAESIAEAVADRPETPRLECDLDAIREAFPVDLWN